MKPQLSHAVMMYVQVPGRAMGCQDMVVITASVCRQSMHLTDIESTFRTEGYGARLLQATVSRRLEMQMGQESHS